MSRRMYRVCTLVGFFLFRFCFALAIGFGSAIKKTVGARVWGGSILLFRSQHGFNTIRQYANNTNNLVYAPFAPFAGFVCVICDEYIGSSRIHLSELEKMTSGVRRRTAAATSPECPTFPRCTASRPTVNGASWNTSPAEHSCPGRGSRYECVCKVRRWSRRRLASCLERMSSIWGEGAEACSTKIS
jgi:hypothetical protein